jgi:single-strand DNA-binding protein
MNKFVGIGNLVRDGEVKTLPSSKVVYSNTLAMRNDFKNKDGEYDSEFINFNVWGASAEHINKYTKKGTKIMIEGRLTTRSYEDKDKIKRYVSEIMVENFEVLERLNKEEKKEEKQDEVTNEYDFLDKEVNLKDEDLPF